MKRVFQIIALLCFALPACAQSTVAVSGHARLPDGSATTNTSIQFELAGCANGQARVDGVAVFSDYKKPFPVDSATGAFSGVLYPNSAIDCNGTLGTTQYNVTVLNPRFNGQTLPYVVGPGAFVLELANPAQSSPAVVTPAAVVVNPQGSQMVAQPAGTVFGVNVLQATTAFFAPISTPVSSSSTCTAGQIWSDANFVYVCTATNTIRRSALASF